MPCVQFVIFFVELGIVKMFHVLYLVYCNHFIHRPLLLQLFNCCICCSNSCYNVSITQCDLVFVYCIVLEIFSSFSFVLVFIFLF